MAQENSFDPKSIKIFNDQLKEAKSLTASLMDTINSSATTVKGNYAELRKDVREITKSFTQLSLLSTNVHNTNISITKVKSLQAKLDDQILNITYKKESLIKNELVLAQGLHKQKLEELKENKIRLDFLKQNKSAHKTEIKDQKAKITLIEEELFNRYKVLDNINTSIELTDEVIKALTLSRNKTSDYEEEWLKANKALGITGKLIKSISKIPIIGQIINAEEALTAMRKSALAGAGTFGLLVSGIKASAQSFSAIDGVLGVASLVFKSIIGINKEIVNIGKALGYSNEKTLALRGNFIQIERLTDNINVNTSALFEAFSQLNQETGFVSNYSADALVTQIKLTKQVGLTASEASKFYELAVLGNTSSDSIYKNFIKSAVGIRNSTKTGLNLVDVIKESSQLSGQLALNLGFVPSRLAEAVGVAKSLGFEMNQLKTIGSNLLNFESSISNELKAEVVTGKQLNLEKARYAALMGDQVMLTQEIAKNVGTINDYQKLNVIQQNTLAEAFGLTSDEVTNMLRKQQLAVESGKSLAQVTKEEAQTALERQNIQEKFSASLAKMGSLLVNIVSNPLSDFVDGFSNVTKFVNNIGTGMNKILGNLGLKGTAGALSKIPTMAIVGGLLLDIKHFMTRGTILNPLVVRNIGAGGSGSLWNGRNVGGQFRPGGGRYPAGTRLGGLRNNIVGGAKWGGIGLAASVGTSIISSQLEKGITKSVVDGVGNTLGMAGTGAMIGSVIPGIGTGIGAIAGGIVGLTMSITDYMEENKQQSNKLNKVLSDLSQKDSNIYIDREKLGMVAEGIGHLSYKLS